MASLDDMRIGCPYKGLLPFEERDNRIFFGRVVDRQIIAANLRASRLTLLYGASGVGKSSVLQAGVVHDLREELKRNRERTGFPRFAVASFGESGQWRDDPMRGLTSCAQAAVDDALGVNEAPHPTTPVIFVDFLLELTARLKGELFFILDQFEEYFLYHPRDEDPLGFAEQFARAIATPNLKVNFLISMREEAIARLDRFKGRITGLFENYLRLDHLDLTGAKLAIEEPIKAYNECLCDGEQPVSIDPELVQAVLNQVEAGRRRPSPIGEGTVRTASAEPEGTPRIDTGFLQLVMTRLWEEEIPKGSRRLRVDTLEQSLGGAESIVRTHLDELLEGLPPEGREAAAKVFRHLVTRSGTKIAQSLQDLADFTELPQERLKPVLERLSAGKAWVLRRVTPPLGGEAVRFEIAHDALAEAIADWRQRFERELAARKAEEQAREEAYREAEHRRKKILLMSTIVIIAGFVVGIVAYREKVHETQKATEHRQVLARHLAYRAHNTPDPRVKALLAAASLKLWTSGDAFELLYRGVRMMPSEFGWQPPSDQRFSTVAFSPEGFFVAAALNGPVYIYRRRSDGTIAPDPWRQLPHDGRASHVAVSRAAKEPGRRLAVAVRNGAASDIKVWNLDEEREIASLTVEGTLRAMALSPDGQQLAACTLEGKLIRKHLSHPPYEESSVDVGPELVGMAFASVPRSSSAQREQPSLESRSDPGNAYSLILVRRDGTLMERSSANGSAPIDLPDPKPTNADDLPVAVAISPDGSRFAKADKEGVVTVLGVPDLGKSIPTDQEPAEASPSEADDRPDTEAISSVGKRVVKADKTLVGVPGRKERVLKIQLRRPESVLSLVFAPDGRSLAAKIHDREAGHGMRRVRVWEVETGAEISRIDTVADAGQIAVGPGGEWIAMARPRPRLWHTWDVKFPEVVRPERKGTFAPSPPGFHIVAQSQSKTDTDDRDDAATVDITRLSNDKSKRGVASLEVDKENIYTAWALSDNGRHLVAGKTKAPKPREKASDASESRGYSENEAPEWWISLWDVRTRAQRGQWRERGPITYLAVGRDGRHILSRSEDGTARVWLAQGEQRVLWDGSPRQHPSGRVALSGSGRWLAVASDRGGFRLKDLDNPEGTPVYVRELSIPRPPVEKLLFSPDEHRIVSAHEDGTAVVWDITTGPLQLRKKLTSGSRVAQIAFSPDGTRIAISGKDKSLSIWSLPDNEEDDREIFLATAGEVDASQMAFSNDGLLIATVGRDRYLLRIWNIDTEGEIVRLPVSPDDWFVDFAGDDHVATITLDGVVSYWPLREKAYIETACERLGSGLSRDEWKRLAGNRELEYYDPVCPATESKQEKQNTGDISCESHPEACRQIVMRAMEAHQQDVGLIVGGKVESKNELVINARAISSLIKRVPELSPEESRDSEKATKLQILAERFKEESESDLHKFIEAVAAGNKAEINNLFKFWRARCDDCHREFREQ
jgi:WD40 repeat protein/cytochrome c556